MRFYKHIRILGSLVLAGWIGAGAGCNSSETPEKPQPVSVTLNFEVYNHTQGYRTEFSKTAMSGDNIIIKVSELGVDDVDALRIAIKEDNFGRLVTFNNTGEATFYAPKQNTNYDVILFNKLRPGNWGEEISYSWMDGQDAQLYKGTHNYIAYRKDRDGVTGPERVWGGEFLPETGNYGVFDQLSSALDLGWVTWGHIARNPGGSSGDFSYGYGICLINGIRGDGLHGYSSREGIILVDPEMNHYSPMAMTAVGLSEAFEDICVVQNIGGNPSLMTIQKWGVLNQNGKDLFAYVFAKE